MIDLAFLCRQASKDNDALRAQVNELLEEIDTARKALDEQATVIAGQARTIAHLRRMRELDEIARRNDTRIIELLQQCIVKLGDKIAAAEARAESAEALVEILQRACRATQERVDFLARLCGQLEFELLAARVQACPGIPVGGKNYESCPAGGKS